MKWMRRIALSVAVLSTVAGNVFAQGYPMAWKAGTTGTNCPQTVCPKTPNLPPYPYAAPLSRFVGRYVDSALTRDYQQPLRTLRGRHFKMAPERGKLYMALGSTFAAYDFSNFVNELKADGSNLVAAPVSTVGRDGLTQEKHHRPHGYVYPEEKNSGWTTPVRDGQDRLGEFDWDDRGYNYLGYSIFHWGIVQDAEGRMPLVKQVLMPDAQNFGASMILAVKSGTKYYVLVGAGGSSFGIWDVTNPAAPVFVREVAIDVESWARSGPGSNQLVAIGARDESLQIFKIDTLLSGRTTPDASFPGNGRINGVTSDGSTFYSIRSTGQLGIYSGSINAPASYSERTYLIESGYTGLGLHVANGVVTTWGSSGGQNDIRIARILSSGLEPVPLNGYFKHAYTAGHAGYAKPDGYVAQPKGAAVVREGGKDYLIYAGHGIGEVYEIQSRDTVGIAHRVVGTTNTFSNNKEKAPYYSDPIEFSATATAATRATFNFDNPEATDNASISVTTPATYTRQYQGVAATNIGKTRNVSLTAYGDPTNADSLSLTLLVPEAAVSLRRGSTITKLAPSQTPVVALYGDELLDASDGKIEGHYSSWTLGGVVSERVPSDPLPLTSCESNVALSLAAHYVPYSASGTTITPALPLSSHYVPTVSGITLDVRPFVAAIGSPVRNSDGSVTFPSATVFSPAVLSTGEAIFTWKLLPSDGGTPVLNVSGAVTVGSAASDADAKFTVPSAELVSGRQVVLEVTTAAFNTAAVGCATYATSTSLPYTMRIPDPVITVNGCARVGDPCTLTASSTAGEMTGWTYTWKVDGTTMVSNSATATSYSPNLTTPKTYTFELVASNVMGATSATRTQSVEQAACAGYVTSLSFTWTGANSGCLYTNCTTNEPLVFTPTAWGYQFQECDTYLWNFGDGSSSTQKTPTKSFSGSGPWTVKLTVKNQNGSTTATQTVSFGTVTPPPPPPPPPCPSTAPSQTGISIRYNGTSGCSLSNPNCLTTDTISFAVDTWGYSLQSCDSVSWNFGDGRTSSSRTPTYKYSAAGTYVVRLTVSNSRGSVTKETSINVASGQTNTCNAISNRALADFTWSAPSGCSRNNGNPCMPNEAVSFTAAPFGYTLQECDIVSWDFGDGKTGEGKQINHTYTSGGSYRVTVSIRNSVTTTPITGGNNIAISGAPAVPPPTDVVISTPGRTSYAKSSAIQFAGAASGVDPAATWLWEFGDGTTANVQNPIKTYTAAGTYTVKLTVKNSASTNSWAFATKQITVTEGKAFAFLLPAVIHVKLPDNGGTWLTDLQIYNPDPAFTPTKPLELSFEAPGIAPTTTVLVDASTYIKENVMSLVTTSTSVQGALIIRGIATDEASVPQMWTRTYLQASNGIGGYGQFIPAIPLHTQQDATAGARQYVLAGLKGDAIGTPGFRTNIGVVNPTAQAVTVTMTVLDNVNVLPVGEPRQLTIAPYSLHQINGVQGPAGETFSIRFVSESGSPIVAYASMVDNISNDPIYIAAVGDDDTSDAAFASQVLPGVGRLESGNWKSDITIYNPERSGGVQFDIAYYDQSGTKLAEAKDVALGSNKFLHVSNLMSAGLLAPEITGNAYGTLRIETKTPGITRYPIAYARTFSDQGPAGSFGQGIPAFAASHANVIATAPAIIAGVRNQTGVFKTNIGIVSTSNEASAVRVTLLDATSGQPIGEPVSVGVAPYQSVAPFDVFFATGMLSSARASVKVELLSGAPVWAFASIIDQTTKDPEYVPAVPLR